MAESPYTVASLAKGVRLLSVFSEQRRQLRLADLAEYTKLPVPTVYRLVKTLEAEGYIEQLEDGSFRPGFAVLSLGFAALRGSNLVEASIVPIRRLADETHETVSLAVLIGVHILYLARIRNKDLITAAIEVGSSLPAYCTSLGKLQMALLAPEDLEQRLGDIDFSEGRGPRAYRTLPELLKDLEVTRARGWGLQDEELAHAVRSISAPIRDRTGKTVAAINLTVQASRYSTTELVDRFLGPIMRAAQEASERLGYAPDTEAETRAR